MVGHQRVKDIDYDDDDLYDEEEETYGEEEATYTAEDRDNFNTLTPVVRAELEEAGLQASDREIQDSLWHYYWDVAKSVSYLKNTKKPKQQQQPAGKKEKAPNRFDQAAEASKKVDHAERMRIAQSWFCGISWSHVPSESQGRLEPPATNKRPPPTLLGGSSKLAKLAEERRRKAAGDQPAAATSDGAFSSLDRLSKGEKSKENETPTDRPAVKKYPIRKKKEPTPPPREPTPPPEPPKEEVPDLRASPTDFGRTLSRGSGSNATELRVSLQDIVGSMAAADEAFKGPSPDDVVARAQSGSDKSKQQADGLAKKTEALKLDSASSLPPQPKVRSKGLNVPMKWEEQRASRKQSAAFVVIGHVDHGKSTLMGRLLLDTGAVAQRDIDRFKKQAADIGKSSFALAWVMDTGSEERERGVTVDIAQHHFSTDKADFTILDAPGHRDFVPNMIGGASMANLAVLVVDANQLESGMKGQTREHIRLAHAVGLKKIVVAVNKLDTTNPPWNQDTFQTVKTEVSKFLSEIGFPESDVTFVPCSGLGGENVVKPASVDWVSTQQTLLQQLEQSLAAEPTEALLKGPFRLQITDVFRGGVQNPLSISGLVSAGTTQTGDVFTVQPSGETATIKAIEVSNESREWAVAGEICTLHLADIEAQHLRSGDMLCSSTQPVSVVKTFTTRVQAIDALLPQGVDVHIGRLHVPGSVAQLVATVDGKGEILKKKPRVVKAGMTAVIKVSLEEGAPLEVGDRVVLRSGGTTVAAGVVE